MISLLLFVCLEGTTDSTETMNPTEQVIVFVVVGLAMVLFIGVFIVFVCRCNKRCPTYRYSIALFDHSPRRVSSTPLCAGGLPLPSTAAAVAQSLNKPTTEPCTHLPPYSEQSTVSSTRSKTPPPDYALVCELVSLSRPPSYESFKDNESETSENSWRFVTHEMYLKFVIFRL